MMMSVDGGGGGGGQANRNIATESVVDQCTLDCQTVEKMVFSCKPAALP